MAGTIEHKWNGTVLTITSDSGTSSADLKGAKGDDGARGAQGSVCDVAVMANYVAANAAPAGYGYGGSVPYVSVSDKWTDTAYNTALDGLLSGMKDGEAKQIRIPYIDGTTTYGNVFKTTNDYATVVCYGYGSYGIIARKTKYNGYWTDWEWDNPPMALGVEYRTTERSGGNPVYVKQVYVGALPNTSNKYTEALLPLNITPTEIKGVGVGLDGSKHAIPIPSMYTYVSVDGEWGSMYISTSSDYSNYGGYITVKYTKN